MSIRGLIVMVMCGFLATSGNLIGQAVLLDRKKVSESNGVQLKRDGWTRKDMELAKEMGFALVRKSIYWQSVEKEKGVYNAAAWDKLFDDAEQVGLTVICCLYGSNSLYEKPMDDRDRAVNTDAARKGFAQFAAHVVERYKGKKVIWEIWNEPNTRTFWHWNGKHNSEQFAEEYTLLVKETASAMLKADPNAVIVAGSVSNYWKPSYEWTEFCFQKGILKTGIKGWSVHPYGVKSPEEYQVGHQITRELLTKYGAGDLPMINSERGFAVEKPKSDIEQEGFSGGKQEVLEEYQAQHFVRQFMADQMADVRLTNWFEQRGGSFGLFDDAGKERPAARAARVMIKELGDYTFAGTLPTGFAQDYATVWANGKPNIRTERQPPPGTAYPTSQLNNKKIAIWTAPQAGKGPDEVRPHIVKLTGASRLSAVDLYGQPLKIDAVGGVYSLNITSAPIYLTVPAGDSILLEAVVPAVP